MADTKISLLTELTDPVAGDSLPIVDASTSSTKKVTVATLDGRYIVEADVAAKGDIYVATANDTVGVLTVGSNDQVLTADSATATGVKWATPTAYQPLDADLTTIAAANNGSVLAATTASFTTADESKLDGIEAAADVTDATNVSAAGAPIISSGAGAPASTPAKVGDIYIDTTGDNAYIAVGTASSADWEISNDGAGSGSTDLSWVAATSTVASSTGTDATLTAADGTNPGLMTSAQFTKLAGIEAAADVTDTTNVAAAGAVMESDTSTSSMSFVIDEDNMASNSATKVPTQQSVKAYADTMLPKVAGGASVENIGAVEENVETASVTTSKTLDTSVYGVFDMTMTGATTFTFSNPAPSGKATTFVLILRGAFTPTLPASIDWGDGAAPTYTTPSVYTFVTIDGGTTYLGTQAGKAFA